jgi:hypothetical protein
MIANNSNQMAHKLPLFRGNSSSITSIQYTPFASCDDYIFMGCKAVDNITTYNVILSPLVNYLPSIQYESTIINVLHTPSVNYMQQSNTMQHNVTPCPRLLVNYMRQSNIANRYAADYIFITQAISMNGNRNCCRAYILFLTNGNGKHHKELVPSYIIILLNMPTDNCQASILYYLQCAFRMPGLYIYYPENHNGSWKSSAAYILFLNRNGKHATRHAPLILLSYSKAGGLSNGRR